MTNQTKISKCQNLYIFRQRRTSQPWAGSINFDLTFGICNLTFVNGMGWCLIPFTLHYLRLLVIIFRAIF